MQEKAPPPKPVIRKYAMHLIRHHYPRKNVKIQVLHGGATNHVFLATAGKEEVVVRISEEIDKINYFLKEQWAVTKAHAKRIPVPEILEVGNTIIPLPYMISSKAHGEVALDHPGRKEILFQMGRMAARIHKIKTSGFGRFFDWSSNTLSKSVKWKDFLNGELDTQNRVAILKSTRMLSARQLNLLKTEISNIATWKGGPCLQHGDLRLKNIMVEKTGKISAIIDWEECISAIGPSWDLSIALHDLPIDGQQRFLEGYGIKPAAVIKMKNAFKVFNILNYTPVIEKLAGKNKTDQLAWYRSRMLGAMDLFSI